jgi:hypothetical protein
MAITKEQVQAAARAVVEEQPQNKRNTFGMLFFEREEGEEDKRDGPCCVVGHILTKLPLTEEELDYMFYEFNEVELDHARAIGQLRSLTIFEEPALAWLATCQMAADGFLSSTGHVKQTWRKSVEIADREA